MIDDSAKPYTPNKDLELTPQSEIIRLRKVIDEKNELIAKFKKYDEERKNYYRRFKQNYDIMEERFNEFLEAINDCDDMEPGTKGFYKAVVMRLYKGRVEVDKEKSVLQMAHAALLKFHEGFDNFEKIIMSVGNVQKRSELLVEFQKMRSRFGNIVGRFKNNMDKLK